MDTFYSIEDIEIIEIEASEKIEKKSLKSFILTFLELNNINLPKNSKIILNYIFELKIYQLLIIKINFKYLEIQLFSEICKKNDQQNNQKDKIAFLYKNYILIFKNSKIYYLQKVVDNIETMELLSYLNKNFGITINTFIISDKESLNIIRNEFLKSKNSNSIKFFNLNKNYSLYIYFSYLIFSILAILYFYINRNIETKEDFQSFDKNSILESCKFNSFEEKTKRIIFKLNKQNLKLISFEFNTNILKMEITSENKDNIYKFLEDKEIVFSSSTIDFFENENIFKVGFDVKLFE